jgi:hypothetical protein
VSTETVTISKQDYEDLQRSAAKLQALENGGVDNWEYYSKSLEEYYAEWEDD